MKWYITGVIDIEDMLRVEVIKLKLEHAINSVFFVVNDIEIGVYNEQSRVSSDNTEERR